MATRLGKSGLFQTGDLLLTFRSEWGGAGAYPNVQMGISHTGIAYVKDGELHNIDNPLNEEYLGTGMRADLTSEHYSTLNYIHVIRPRDLTDARARQHRGLGDAPQQQRQARLSDPDQVQRRLQRAEVSSRASRSSS